MQNVSASASPELDAIEILMRGRETEETWEHKEDALRRLHAILSCQSVDSTPHELLLAAFRRMLDDILSAVLSLRTTLVAAACAAIEGFCRILGDSLDPLADTVLVALARGVASTKRMVHIACASAFSTFLMAITPRPRIVERVLVGFEDKSPQVQTYTMLLIESMLVESFFRLSAPSVDLISKVVGRGLGSRAPEVRDISRECFWVLESRSKPLAEELLQSLDSDAKKVLSKNTNRTRLPARGSIVNSIRQLAPTNPDRASASSLAKPTKQGSTPKQLAPAGRPLLRKNSQLSSTSSSPRSSDSHQSEKSQRGPTRRISMPATPQPNKRQFPTKPSTDLMVDSGNSLTKSCPRAFVSPVHSEVPVEYTDDAVPSLPYQLDDGDDYFDASQRHAPVYFMEKDPGAKTADDSANLGRFGADRNNIEKAKPDRTIPIQENKKIPERVPTLLSEIRDRLERSCASAVDLYTLVAISDDITDVYRLCKTPSEETLASANELTERLLHGKGNVQLAVELIRVYARIACVSGLADPRSRFWVDQCLQFLVQHANAHGNSNAVLLELVRMPQPNLEIVWHAFRTGSTMPADGTEIAAGLHAMINDGLASSEPENRLAAVRILSLIPKVRRDNWMHLKPLHSRLVDFYALPESERGSVIASLSLQV